MIQMIEELTMNAWPALQTVFYDGWVLRFADGYTKRANSISAVYQSSINPDDKIDYCEKKYGAFGLPTIFKLTEESNPPGLDELLAKKGYVKLDETALRLLDLTQNLFHKPKDVVIDNKFNDFWLQGYFNCSTTDLHIQATARKILANIRGEVICAVKTLDNNVVGCGFGAIERDYVGIYDIIVDKKYRKQGYGLDIMNGILSEAKRKGIRTSYLQVVVGNAPAENLYSKLGYQEMYRYWYRKLETKK